MQVFESATKDENILRSYPFSDKRRTTLNISKDIHFYIDVVGARMHVISQQQTEKNQET